MKKAGRYAAILEGIFASKWKTGMQQVDFEREEIVTCARELGVALPKNLGDLVYSFRYRSALPDSIRRRAPEGYTWIIRGVGEAKYRFVLVPDLSLRPSPSLAVTKVPDSTPGVVARYALSDEQAILALVRYNRLVDIFTGIACYSLQNHLRTTVGGLGQVETDELYVGLDRKGAQYVIPVQAKSGKDRLSVVQVEQDIEVCKAKFPSLVCRPLGAQFMSDNVIALFEFEQTEGSIKVASERHYKLVPQDQVTDDELIAYRSRLGD